MRERKIIKYGGSYLIKLDPADIRDFKLKDGDTVDIEDLFKEKKK